MNNEIPSLKAHETESRGIYDVGKKKQKRVSNVLCSIACSNVEPFEVFSLSKFFTSFTAKEAH